MLRKIMEIIHLSSSLSMHGHVYSCICVCVQFGDVCMHKSMLVCRNRAGMCNMLKQVTATSLLAGLSWASHTYWHTLLSHLVPKHMHILCLSVSLFNIFVSLSLMLSHWRCSACHRFRFSIFGDVCVCVQRISCSDTSLPSGFFLNSPPLLPIVQPIFLPALHLSFLIS